VSTVSTLDGEPWVTQGSPSSGRDGFKPARGLEGNPAEPSARTGGHVRDSFGWPGRIGARATVDDRVLRTARLLLPLAALVCALAAAAPGATAGNRNLLSYGDSLSVGTDLFLRAYLHGWRVDSETSISRHADAVPAALRSYGSALPRVIVVSAGTNDDPGRVSGFAHIVRETLAIAGPKRCVVWSTIVRPAYEGVSYTGYNRALTGIARTRANLRIFDWVSMARAHPSWFGSDGVHPTATGYRARAAAIARLVRGCPA
jgi:hypothetical protein